MAAPLGNFNHYKHGLSHTRIDNIYKAMKSRCYNKENNRYNSYGGRGIVVCDEWLGENGLVNFYNWAINNGYNNKLTIDRIDTNGDYCPSNCRWETQKVQQNNRTNNKIIEFDNEAHTLGEWSDITGVKLATLSKRLIAGWSVARALTTIPKIGANQYTKNGDV